MKLIDELQNMVNYSEDGYITPYPGHAFESEMLEIDALVSIFDIGTEGNIYSNLEFILLETAYENESGKFDFSEFTGFGTESITEKIKQTPAKIVAFFKKILNGIKGFIKQMIHAFNLVVTFILRVMFTLIGLNPTKQFKIRVGKEFVYNDNESIKIHDYSGFNKLIGQLTDKNIITNLDSTTKTIDKSENISKIQGAVIRLINNMTFTFGVEGKIDEDASKETIEREAGGDFKRRLADASDKIVLNSLECKRSKAIEILSDVNSGIRKYSKEQIDEFGKKLRFKIQVLEKSIEQAHKRIMDNFEKKIKSMNIDSIKTTDDFYKAMDKGETKVLFGDADAVNTAEGAKNLTNIGVLVAQVLSWETAIISKTTKFLKTYTEDVKLALKIE